MLPLVPVLVSFSPREAGATALPNRVHTSGDPGRSAITLRAPV